MDDHPREWVPQPDPYRGRSKDHHGAKKNTHPSPWSSKYTVFPRMVNLNTMRFGWWLDHPIVIIWEKWRWMPRDTLILHFEPRLPDLRSYWQFAINLPFLFQKQEHWGATHRSQRTWQFGCDIHSLETNMSPGWLRKWVFIFNFLFGGIY